MTINQIQLESCHQIAICRQATYVLSDALPVSDVAPLLHPQLIFYAPLDHGPNSIGYVSNAMEAVVSPVGEQSEIGRPFFSLQNSVRLSFRLRVSFLQSTEKT